MSIIPGNITPKPDTEEALLELLKCEVLCSHFDDKRSLIFRSDSGKHARLPSIIIDTKGEIVSSVLGNHILVVDCGYGYYTNNAMKIDGRSVGNITECDGMLIANLYDPWAHNYDYGGKGTYIFNIEDFEKVTSSDMTLTEIIDRLIPYQCQVNHNQ